MTDEDTATTDVVRDLRIPYRSICPSGGTCDFEDAEFYGLCGDSNKIKVACKMKLGAKRNAPRK